MEKSPVKVSVLMLTYNQRDYIARAIESVLAQRVDFDYEIVIADDCSNDGTTDICREYALRYPDKIRLLERPENMGLIPNFLDAYGQCRGEYVAICEGDDYWCSRKKLARQAAFLDANPSFSITFHRVFNLYVDSGTWSLSNGGQLKTTDIHHLSRSNYISNVSAMFRRIEHLPSWFALVGTYDYPLHMLNAARGSINYDRRPMAVYRQHSKAVWSRARADKKLLMAAGVRELMIDHFSSTDNRDTVEGLKQGLNAIYIALIRLYRSQGDGEAEKEIISKYLNLNPDNNSERLEQLIAKKAPKKPIHKRFLTATRTLVSRIIPLPR